MLIGPTELLLYTTVKMVRMKDGVEDGSGTAFFYEVITPNKDYVPLLVTNKHVVEDADEVSCIIRLADQADKTAPSDDVFTARFPVNCAIHHPDPEVDLCAFPLADIEQQIWNKGRKIYSQRSTRQTIPTQMQWDNFDGIEGVMMVGCPNGLYDDFNYLPLARTGMTASHIRKNFGGKNEFLVDMACFPGSSGSPVFLADNGRPVWARDDEPHKIFGQAYYLLGVLYSGPLAIQDGRIVMVHDLGVEVETVMHLGFVIRATELLEFDRQIYAQLGWELPPDLM